MKTVMIQETKRKPHTEKDMTRTQTEYKVLTNKNSSRKKLFRRQTMVKTNHTQMIEKKYVKTRMGTDH